MSLLLDIAAGWVSASARRKTSILLLVFALFFFAIWASCGSPSQSHEGTRITFGGTKQVHRQRETVTARVQPALGRKEILQIWVRADDHQWYPCEPGKSDPSSGVWNATCQFGSNKHPAAQGAQFVLGALYTTNRIDVEYLPDSVWYLLKTQQTDPAPVVFSRSN